MLSLERSGLTLLEKELSVRLSSIEAKLDCLILCSQSSVTTSVKAPTTSILKNGIVPPRCSPGYGIAKDLPCAYNESDPALDATTVVLSEVDSSSQSEASRENVQERATRKAILRESREELGDFTHKFTSHEKTMTNQMEELMNTYKDKVTSKAEESAKQSAKIPTEEAYRTKIQQIMNSSVDKDARHWTLWELVMAWVVVVNILIMCVERQILGVRAGRMFGYNAVAADFAPDAEEQFQRAEYVFAAMYTLDLVGKIVVERGQWWRSSWNWFDLIVVTLIYLDMALVNTATVDPAITRVCKTVRLLRLIKLMRSIEMFETCVVMLRSLAKSVVALFWTALLIFIITMAVSLALSQGLSSILEDDSLPISSRSEIYHSYGTFSRTLLTIFEVTLGNWGPPAWILVDNVSEWFILFFLAYKVSAGFAVINIITAVFLRQTMKCSEEIDEFTISQKKKMQETYLKRLLELFEEMDTSGDGEVSFEEFSRIMESPSVLAWLELLEVSANDSMNLFQALDVSEDGSITIDEWLEGVQRIRGEATAVDAMTIMAGLSRIEMLIKSSK